MLSFFQFPNKFEQYVAELEKKIEPRKKEIEEIVEYNQAKVLKAFQQHHVTDFHLQSSTGYGYDDLGRETLDQIYADVFETEAGIVRPHIVSGTHALAIGLFGLLRPGDELMYITGSPYDTLEEVIGIHGEGMGSLKEWGIQYQSIPLNQDGTVNYQEIKKRINEKTKVIAIQRSRGYSWRPSFGIDEIKEMIQFVKGLKPDVITFIDNCYGEFTDKHEPTAVGADVVVGSLIKNPGGGIAKTGGYIVGKEKYIKQISYRLSAPGIGSKVGSMYGHMIDFYQGFFLAPHMVGEALKGGIFASALLEGLGFITNPHWTEKRNDIIQAIQFDNAKSLIAFLQGIQKGSPIDSHVVPEPSKIPGYQDPVIMAAGTFVQGASLELSGDAPIREPYIAYIQGGLTYQHMKWGLFTAIQKMIDQGILSMDFLKKIM
ncbi:aminotransferase class I/II-fold pyridoxal phosphate-dependent enzyme [Tepidibacillus fermentans]|uniref:Cystathionine beta-lyase family protein involved in aluminum resistance n=1 Tax=Tepidibacillus fermentans TaxID=1281767 RepID=A0A4R3KHU0_9BACI|nr:methionine gamma-lyase family protein [Tepidibacillus fermentans]TCS83045.1 cystathionine beta-lyase family protein involved in aluminum resistance [Tepidibacillus fermentans]